MRRCEISKKRYREGAMAGCIRTTTDVAALAAARASTELYILTMAASGHPAKPFKLCALPN
jgi:hypothetical protein